MERNKSEPVVHHISSSSAAAPRRSSQPTTSSDSNPDLTITSATSRSDRLARKRSKSRSTQGDFRIQLTLEQKLDIVILEYDQTKNEKVRRETAHEKRIDQLEVCFNFILFEIFPYFFFLSLLLNGLILKQWILI